MTAPNLATYGGLRQQIGYEGGQVDMTTSTTISKISDLALAIDFGRAVARSANDESCKAPTADGDKLLGVSVRDGTIVFNSSGQALYTQNIAVPIMTEGRIFAVAFENATRGDGVISVTAQNGRLGSTTGGAAGAGRVALGTSTWENTVTAGAIGIVAVRVPT